MFKKNCGLFASAPGSIRCPSFTYKIIKLLSIVCVGVLPINPHES